MSEDLPPDGPPRGWKHSALRLARDLAIGVALLAVALPIIGWLRAPDLPEVAPPFALQDLAGETVRLADLRGQTVVLNFWATWCGPCRAEIPTFSRFARNNPDVPVLGIAVDGTASQLKAASKRMGIDYPVLLANRATVQAYKAHTLPTTVVVDEEGKVRSAHVGIMLPPQLAWATR